LDDYLLFTGYVSENDLLRYLSSVDVFVDPDPSNPFTDRSTMIKMMEYMAYERPIVAFDLTEHRVTAQRAAAYVKPNDEREFARTIISLMDDPQQREEMGSFGRRRVERELAWIHQEGCLLSAYRQLQAAATSPHAMAEDGQAAAKPKRCHGSERVSASR
jgi:glycosyltransferase involved in cell wall biosynthesis